tara:strand:+ start:1057 stop:1770 length:714 start_codon:yes stop_codon:yes gene_type:complete
MKTPPNLTEVKQRLYETLKSSGWADVLKGFLLGNEMDIILETLYREREMGDRFTPTLKQVFRAFELCPYNQVKLVMIGQDPYPHAGVADGLAFSCGNDHKIQASLKFMHQEIQDTVYTKGKYYGPSDLTVWAKQGVLLLNIALTTTIGRVGTHYLLWRPFMAYLLDVMGWNKPGLVWVFIGAKARDYKDSLPDNNYKLTCSHPASAAHQKLEKWNSDDIFNRINKSLVLAGKTPILW